MPGYEGYLQYLTEEEMRQKASLQADLKTSREAVANIMASRGIYGGGRHTQLEIPKLDEAYAKAVAELSGQYGGQRALIKWQGEEKEQAEKNARWTNMAKTIGGVALGLALGIPSGGSLAPLGFTLGSAGGGMVATMAGKSTGQELPAELASVAGDWGTMKAQKEFKGIQDKYMNATLEGTNIINLLNKKILELINGESESGANTWGSFGKLSGLNAKKWLDVTK